YVGRQDRRGFRAILEGNNGQIDVMRRCGTGAAQDSARSSDATMRLSDWESAGSDLLRFGDVEFEELGVADSAERGELVTDAFDALVVGRRESPVHVVDGARNEFARRDPPG